MLGIVFTTPEDASAFLSRHTTGNHTLEEGAPIELDDLLVAVTGPGKIKSTLAAERLLRTHSLDALVHTGTCTALAEELSVGTVVGASFVLEGDRVELEAPTYPRMPLECPYDVDVEGTLVSQDHTPDDGDGLSYWARLADVRDQTSYAVAYVAAQHGVPCHVAKVVHSHLGQEPDATPSSSKAIASFLHPVVEAATPAAE